MKDNKYPIIFNKNGQYNLLKGQTVRGLDSFDDLTQKIDGEESRN
jgi:hypothetical protein